MSMGVWMKYVGNIENGHQKLPMEPNVTSDHQWSPSIVRSCPQRMVNMGSLWRTNGSHRCPYITISNHICYRWYISERSQCSWQSVPILATKLIKQIEDQRPVTTDLLGYIAVCNATFNNIKGKSWWTCFKVSLEAHYKMIVKAK